MTPLKAAMIRSECIEGKRPTRKEIREQKKAVMLFLSKEAHDVLTRERIKSGKNFSETIDNALLDLSKIDRILGTEHGSLESALEEIRIQLWKLQNKQIEDGKKFTQRASQQFAQWAQEKEAEHRYRDVLDQSYDVIYRVDLKEGRFDYVSPSSQWNWHMNPEELRSIDPEDIMAMVYPGDREKLREHVLASFKTGPKGIGRHIEYRVKLQDGEDYRWFSQTQRVIFDDNNEAVAMVGNVRDITERKKAEEKLLDLVNQLERKVKEYSTNLEEKNAALKVLLKQNQEEKAEMEEKILLNVKELIMPAVEKMKHGRMKNLKKHIAVLESNLSRITSSFSSKLTSKALNLSHQEIQVANYVMHGRTTKEIAELMGLAERTIDFHRAKIRKKMGLLNQKEGLRIHLLSFQ